jgi:hypothetical protein
MLLLQAGQVGECPDGLTTHKWLSVGFQLTPTSAMYVSLLRTLGHLLSSLPGPQQPALWQHLSEQLEHIARPVFSEVDALVYGGDFAGRVIWNDVEGKTYICVDPSLVALVLALAHLHPPCASSLDTALFLTASRVDRDKPIIGAALDSLVWVAAYALLQGARSTAAPVGAADTTAGPQQTRASANV